MENNFEDFENYKNVREYTYEVTGHEYYFATSSSRIWGDNKRIELEDYESLNEQYQADRSSMAPSEIYNVEHGTFYQLMPVHFDDGFFNWYCHERDDYQDFKTKEICLQIQLILVLLD